MLGPASWAQLFANSNAITSSDQSFLSNLKAVALPIFSETSATVISPLPAEVHRPVRGRKKVKS
jgi:hypothetical protein